MCFVYFHMRACLNVVDLNVWMGVCTRALTHVCVNLVFVYVHWSVVSHIKQSKRASLGTTCS